MNSMTKKEMSALLEAFSERVVEKLAEALSAKNGNSEPELIDTNESARILGISRAYLLSIKDKFGYIKLGETKQSRIFFKRDDILAEFRRVQS